MKEKLKILWICVTLTILIFSLSGCGNQTQENTIVEKHVENTENNIRNEIIEEQNLVKNGRYDIIVEEQNEELPDEDIYLEIYDGELKLVDGYARITQIGAFEEEGNKIVGTYNEIEYFDQNTNSMSKKEINDELEFEILEEGILKDNKGFGKIFETTLYQGETYKLSQEYGNSDDWEELYLGYIKNNLKESEDALEEEGLLQPFIGLIDLNFDDVPELLYYDAVEFINTGDMYANVYTIENGKVTYKTQIAIRRDERFLKLSNSKLIIHYEGDNEPDFSNLKIIENLQGKTISTYKGKHSIWLDDKAQGNSETMSEAEYNQILIQYFDNSDLEPEILKTYTLMEHYSDEEKEEIFTKAVEEYRK